MNGTKKVLMIGGTGIISTDCTLLAAEKKSLELILLNRGKNPNFLPDSVRILQADINDAAAVRETLGGSEFDTVCDFISYTPEQLAAKLELFRGRCGQYVFISSAAAYKPRKPDSPLLRTEKNSCVGCTTWSYGYNKSLCERLLREECAASGMKFTIVRPSYTCNKIRFFNPYPISHWDSWTIAQRLLSGKPLVLQDDGGALCTVTQASDFAKAFVGLFGNPAAMNEDFHITSGEYHSWKQIAQIQAELLGVEPHFCFLPTDDLCLELDWITQEKMRHTVDHDCFDSSKVAKAVPEFRCTTSFRDGTAHSIEFYQSHPEFQKVNAWWESAFDRIVEKYGTAE